jgi:7,8-dihydroneopterin aldolase/epimerase/oxygenase
MFYFFKNRQVDQNRIFIRDFFIDMEIGVNDDEKNRKQRVIVNVCVEPKIWPNPSRDNISDTVSYDDIVKIIQNILSADHIHLVETVAEKIANTCIQQLPIKNITVKVEKPDIYGFAIPGVEITRTATARR